MSTSVKNNKVQNKNETANDLKAEDIEMAKVEDS